MDRPLTMIEDLLDDYLFIYGTNEGQRRLEADMLAFLRGAIAAPDRPFPTADEMYIALKTKLAAPPMLMGMRVTWTDDLPTPDVRFGGPIYPAKEHPND